MTSDMSIKTSIRGVPMWDLLSAFQKAVRRSNLHSALHCAADLDQSGWGDALWDRMEIIASEDIGPAEPGLITEILALRSVRDKHVIKNRKTGRLMTMHAAARLALAHKSRLCDNAAHALYGSPKPPYIPDVAHDMHTAQGRWLGRGLQHFWHEGPTDLVQPDDATMDAAEASDGYLAEWMDVVHEVDIEKAHDTWWGRQVKDKDAPEGLTPEEDNEQKGRLL